MHKSRVDFLMLLRQRHPCLNAFNPRPGLAQRAFETLRMADARPGDHPIDLTWPDALLHAGAVAMHDLPVEQIRESRQAYVRMRPHVSAARRSIDEVRGAHVIEENERPDRALRHGRQQPRHFESTEIFSHRVDDKVEHDFSTPATRICDNIASLHASVETSMIAQAQVLFCINAITG
jgi:hypothetical protein